MEGEGVWLVVGGGVIEFDQVGIVAVGGRGLRVIVLDEVLWMDDARS
jgi:hypothetical protein